MPPNPAVGTWPPYLRRQAPGPMPIPAQTTGVARIVVLLIDFTDIAHDPSHDGPYFDARMNAAGSSAHSVGSYYQEVPRGALTVNATVIPMWFHSTHPMSDYGADSATGWTTRTDQSIVSLQRPCGPLTRPSTSRNSTRTGTVSSITSWWSMPAQGKSRAHRTRTSSGPTDGTCSTRIRPRRALNP